ncbi:methyltransferase domain-containing protein [Ditylenchus destructor]|uniref:Methyltransferase domain-containing protein n=1 Tax=Ditylenchus destructor TaxID=166010 RepID=A0AAD4R7Z6_9BILA|nr:methyltransferase domain-containing protein [Ditylenchus destructor]
MNFLQKRLDIRFMNLGYVSPPTTYQSSDKDEIIEKIIAKHLGPNDPIRAHCRLYEKTLSLCPEYPKFSEESSLLEVGCGLGGGLNWIKCSHNEFARVIGLDPVTGASGANQSIVNGRAEEMPFPAQSFDIVLNVESSHLYANTKKFFAEAYRVLKPGGFLCWADLRSKEKMDNVKYEAKECGFELVAFENIIDGAICGIHETSARYEMLLSQAPWYIRLFKNTFRQVYCAPGSKSYNLYINGERVYVVGCWRVPNYVE